MQDGVQPNKCVPFPISLLSLTKPAVPCPRFVRVLKPLGERSMKSTEETPSRRCFSQGASWVRDTDSLTTPWQDSFILHTCSRHATWLRHFMKYVLRASLWRKQLQFWYSICMTPIITEPFNKTRNSFITSVIVFTTVVAICEQKEHLIQISFPL